MKICRLLRLATLLVSLSILTLSGCSPTNKELVTPERLEHGLVLILPGIEGEGTLSYNIRKGLLKAGVSAALPIYRWGRPVPLAGPILNQMDVIGNRLVAKRIAQYIVDYQDSHPFAPVYIIGHSGGGGIAVFTAEELPDGRMIDGLILLSASISKGYDLSKALQHCRKGIVNFYSKKDVGLLGVGTTVVGNVDGVRGPSAGLTGFDNSYPKLYQIPWSKDMESAGNYGGHADSTNPEFVKEYVAPWVMGIGW